MTPHGRNTTMSNKPLQSTPLYMAKSLTARGNIVVHELKDASVSGDVVTYTNYGRRVWCNRSEVASTPEGAVRVARRLNQERNRTLRVSLKRGAQLVEACDRVLSSKIPNKIIVKRGSK